MNKTTNTQEIDLFFENINSRIRDLANQRWRSVQEYEQIVRSIRDLVSDVKMFYQTKIEDNFKINSELVYRIFNQIFLDLKTFEEIPNKYSDISKIDYNRGVESLTELIVNLNSAIERGITPLRNG